MAYLSSPDKDKARALNHPDRVELLNLIRQHPAGITTSDIGKQTGMPARTLRYYLEVLENSFLVNVERLGRTNIYRPEGN